MGPAWAQTAVTNFSLGNYTELLADPSTLAEKVEAALAELAAGPGSGRSTSPAASSEQTRSTSPATVLESQAASPPSALQRQVRLLLR